MSSLSITFFINHHNAWENKSRLYIAAHELSTRLKMELVSHALSRRTEGTGQYVHCQLQRHSKAMGIKKDFIKLSIKWGSVQPGDGRDYLYELKIL